MSATSCSLPGTLRICRYAIALIVITAASIKGQVSEVPFLTGRITDNAEVIVPESRQRITDMIRIHEHNTSNQIAILTTPPLEIGSIEEFAARVFETWKLGEKGKGNGVLVIVSPADRRVRIEVGKGLQPRLSEVAANRIVRDVMAPAFDEGDYSKGLEEGIEAITGQLATEDSSGAAPDTTQTKKKSTFEEPDLAIPERILIGCFIFGIIGLFTVIGVVTPGAGWFLYLFLIPFWAMFPIVVVGVRGALALLVIYLIGFPSAKLYLSRSVWYERAKAQLASKGVANIGGFTVRGNIESSWSTGGRHS